MKLTVNINKGWISWVILWCIVFFAVLFFLAPDNFLLVIAGTLIGGFVFGSVSYFLAVVKHDAFYEFIYKIMTGRWSALFKSNIERSKKRAEGLGLPHLISKLYQRHIRSAPFNIGIPSKQHLVCPLITEAVKLDENKTKIVLNGRSYVFSFEEKTGDIDGRTCTYGLYELFHNKEKVFAFKMVIEDRDFYAEWYLDTVTFKEGHWIDDFAALEREIELKQNKERFMGKDGDQR